MNFLEKYRSTVDEVNRLSLIAFILMLPYPNYIARICWVVFLVTWLLSGRILHKPQISLTKESLLPLVPVLGMVAYFFWGMLSVAWAEDKAAAWEQIGRLVNFLCLAIVLIWGVSDRIRWQQCLNTLVLTAIISVAVYMFLYYWLHNTERAFDKFNDMTQTINWFDVEELTMHIKHRLYYSSILCLAVPSVWLLHNSWQERFGRTKTVVYSSVIYIILTWGILISGSRQSLITLIVIAITLALISIVRKHKATGLALIITSLMVICVCLKLFHPRLQDTTFKEIVAYNPEKGNPALEPRIAIWHVALENPEQYSLYGVGIGNAPQYLLKKYKEKNWQAYAARQYAPHNQYLSVWIELGVLAMLLWLCLSFSIPLFYKGRTRQAALLYTETTALAMFTESVLGKIDGIFLLAATLLLIYLINREEQTK